MYLCLRPDDTYEVILVDIRRLGFNWGECFDEKPNQTPEALDCIDQLLSDNIINAGMPVIMDLWGGNSNCADPDGYETFTSFYKREKCTIPCLTDLGGYQVVELIQCGENTACCIKKQYWCTLSNGEYDVRDTEYYQIGECSQGKPKECSSRGFSLLSQCEPRSCLQPL